ncbi:MAG: SDR family NAD(P)-dependent oxidoreductase [Candidatus ainarchaeum sp.]|nr:SDR family NAD(P)-dependent oxidoreductase [Candidatus ainarchaeum sp.]MDD5163421.1 SDR family NAD(P)-dependent oxidoreductase [Candidatus ainarchaeum sp.]
MKDFFKGKTVLITGGTGFLGRSLVGELLPLGVHSIRVFSRDEVKHHRIQEEFNNDARIRCLVGDVRDYERLERAMKDANIVIHAAAMKRIDLIEYNVMEAVKTNVMGTMNVVNACLKNNVEKAVFVSTDKACSPINSYGATKMLGEKIFIESNYSKGKSKTSFISVRYGNVLESTGSVIPYFVEKIKKCEQIPLTDDRMTRFIITPKQAVGLIFMALKHGVGGEIFVPKLKSLKVVDLIGVLKKHYSSRAGVKETGIRPGEKIHEILMNEDECTRAYDLGSAFAVLSQIDCYQNVKYAYLKEKKKVDFSSYCSKDSLVNPGELEKMLLDLKIIGG